MTETSPSVQSRAPGAPGAPAALYLVGPEGIRVWGLSGAQRLARMASLLGVAASDWAGQAQAGGRVLLARRDAVIGADLLEALLRQDEAVLMDEDGAAALAAVVPAGRAAEAARLLEGGRWIPDESVLPFPAIQPSALAGPYDRLLRKRRARPVARMVDAENRAYTERSLFTGAYKGVTDAVNKYVWPYPAYFLTLLASRAGLAPGIVTLAGIGLALLAMLLFAQGAFGWGLACAWAATLLDVADGKLARVTVRDSAAGAAMDLAEEMLAPPLWYGAWLVGLGAAGAMAGPWGWIAALAVGGYVVTRLQEGWFLRRHGMEIHVWRRGDVLFRLVSARRNPNLALLTLFALAGAPYAGIAAVAVWTGATALVHAVQIAQAETARRKGGVSSWIAG